MSSFHFAGRTKLMFISDAAHSLLWKGHGVIESDESARWTLTMSTYTFVSNEGHLGLIWQPNSWRYDEIAPCPLEGNKITLTEVNVNKIECPLEWLPFPFWEKKASCACVSEFLVFWKVGTYNAAKSMAAGYMYTCSRHMARNLEYCLYLYDGNLVVLFGEGGWRGVDGKGPFNLLLAGVMARRKRGTSFPIMIGHRHRCHYDRMRKCVVCHVPRLFPCPSGGMEDRGVGVERGALSLSLTQWFHKVINPWRQAMGSNSSHSDLYCFCYRQEGSVVGIGGR
ncbi:hypothetical protein CEXT_28531 [Caerostris extrusa]|uniref:Uncharacterized protein n=1 Tax=Caerostris extrusa TaxID=172846 RepID=A0AAV4MTP5_CAEEX|nr:hypothetical protein CEXT_28531 [Caerostris extrusa]